MLRTASCPSITMSPSSGTEGDGSVCLTILLDIIRYIEVKNVWGLNSTMPIGLQLYDIMF